MEAEVFARATRAIRAAEAGTALDRARAVADNRRLGTPSTARGRPRQRPAAALRAGIARIALTVLRECDAAEPDLGFIAEVNEHIAAGLWR